jgi:D-glycero-D-manno-heptose 1,7-bisphosphate phosphatase
MRKAIFLDRDGVINKAILKDGKPFSPRRFEEFKLFNGIREVLEKFRKKEFLNIIVTNQPDIARGLIKTETLEKMHKFIEENLPIDDIFVCPHDDIDNCHCRKPKPGMLLEAAEKWHINLKESFIIGDSWKDIEAGKAAGCATVLLDNLYNKEVEADFRVGDIDLAMKIILNGGTK